MSVLLTGITLSSTSYAAEVKPPAVQAELQITMTQEEIDVLKRALDLAAGTCQTQTDGCIIGASRSVILSVLNTAKPVFPTPDAKK